MLADRAMEIGKDGMIFCLDLRHEEGRAAADKLASLFNEVECAMSMQRIESRRYLLVFSPSISSKAWVVLAAADKLEEAINIVYHRSRCFGSMFATVIVPCDPAVKTMFAMVQGTCGNA